MGEGKHSREEDWPFGDGYMDIHGSGSGDVHPPILGEGFNHGVGEGVMGISREGI